METLKALNEPAEVLIARPIAAGCANQAGARKGPYHNALLGETVDKRLRLVDSPGDQGRLFWLGHSVSAVLQKHCTAALGGVARARKTVVSGLCCERERSEKPCDGCGWCPRAFEANGPVAELVGGKVP